VKKNLKRLIRKTGKSGRNKATGLPIKKNYLFVKKPGIIQPDFEHFWATLYTPVKKGRVQVYHLRAIKRRQKKIL